MKLSLPLSALLMILPLAACSGGQDAANEANQAASDTGQQVAAEAGNVGRAVQEATEKARRELAQGNITISNNDTVKAEISPAGDLLINGAAVTVTDEQRSLLLGYRRQVEAVAGAGMDIGVQGAKLGVQAAGEALKGIFSGDTDRIEARVNAEAAKIEQQAKHLCSLLPGMMASQQALAASLPEFKPYATMDQSDIDDCGK